MLEFNGINVVSISTYLTSMLRSKQLQFHGRVTFYTILSLDRSQNALESSLCFATDCHQIEDGIKVQAILKSSSI